MKPCEVAVVGAGIVGAATAWELHARGVDVALLDRGEVSGATTGLGEGNVLCSDKEAGPELELTLAGLGVFDELEALLGEQARIRRKGALVVHRSEETWADEAVRVEHLRAAGVHGYLVDARRRARHGARAHRRAGRRLVLPGRPAVRAARHRPGAGRRAAARAHRRRGPRGRASSTTG